MYFGCHAHHTTNMYGIRCGTLTPHAWGALPPAVGSWSLQADLFLLPAYFLYRRTHDAHADAHRHALAGFTSWRLFGLDLVVSDAVAWCDIAQRLSPWFLPFDEHAPREHFIFADDIHIVTRTPVTASPPATTYLTPAVPHYSLPPPLGLRSTSIWVCLVTISMEHGMTCSFSRCLFLWTLDVDLACPRWIPRAPYPFDAPIIAPYGRPWPDFERLRHRMTHPHTALRSGT